MANEVTVNTTLDIRKNSIQYVSQPQQFRADMTGQKGPVPGALTVTSAGTDVSFAELTTPGFAMLRNLETAGSGVWVEYGIWDGLEFYPIGRIDAGQFFPIQFSPNLGKSLGTGTGTVDTGSYTLRFKAHGASTAEISVEAFEA